MLIQGCNYAAPATLQSTIPTGAYTITLAADDEPGQRLTIYGQVIDRQTGEPVPFAHVFLYHADANGEYQPVDPDDESTARLSGEVVTGEDGQFVVQTIVPREYDQPGNRHIHLHYIRADGYDDLGGVILFENDVNDEIRQWAESTGFGFIIELTEWGGVMEGNIILQLEPILE